MNILCEYFSTIQISNISIMCTIMGIHSTQHFYQPLEQRHKSTVISFADDRHMGGIANKKRKMESKFKEIMTD